MSEFDTAEPSKPARRTRRSADHDTAAAPAEDKRRRRARPELADEEAILADTPGTETHDEQPTEESDQD